VIRAHALGAAIAARSLAMSIARTAVLLSLALTAGCAAELAIAPTVGAGVGALVGADRRHNGSEVSITSHTLIGAVAGFLVDAIGIAIALGDRPEIVSRQR
jgi:hypothetical protein